VCVCVLFFLGVFGGLVGFGPKFFFLDWRLRLWGGFVLYDDERKERG